MGWPTPQDYSEAIQNPKIAFLERDLLEGRPELDKLGLPKPRSGSFATVYKVVGAPRNWAVKCFLNPVSDQQERYSEISAHLAKINLPYLVQFKFIANGIRVAKQTYPILKMEWVEGETIVSYIEKNRRNPSAMLSLAGRWIKMTSALTKAAIAHGDLQHGNVLIVNGDVRLVDYDGMYVPALSGRRSQERGQRNYQHPQRTEFDYGPNLDNFSSWVIYVSLIAIAVRPQLWEQFRGGDECLLFRQQDFEHPEKSPIFAALENSSDGRIRSLAGLFHSLLDLGPQEVPTLDGQVVPTPSSSSTLAPSQSWINDYVKQPSVAQKIATVAPTVSLLYDPSPSWIHDFIEPASSRSREHEFENSIAVERIVLVASLLALALAFLFEFLGFALWSSVGLTFLVVSTLNLAVWSSRYRSDATFLRLRAIQKELKEIEHKIELNRAVVRSREIDKQSVTERHAFEEAKIVKELEAAQLQEQQEINGAQASFQMETNPISVRRKELTRQETNALQNISNSLGAQLTKLSRQISDLTQSESSELSTTLANQQNQFIVSYLQRWHIDNASRNCGGVGSSTRSGGLQSGTVACGESATP